MTELAHSRTPSDAVHKSVPIQYHSGMATNLRLGTEAQEAVRNEAQRTGRSQQDVIRDAVDRHLGLSSALPHLEEPTALQTSSSALRPPRTPYRRPDVRLVLPDELTLAELLDRDDRV